MNKTILHISNIKTYTKTTKDIIPDDLKHTELLNQLAISFGYRNYLTLKGMADKNDGYIEVNIKDDDISPIVKKRFENIDFALKKFNYPTDSASSSPLFFLIIRHQIIEVASKSLKAFSFIDYDSFDSLNIFNKYISIEYLMYFYFLSIKFNIEDIKQYLNSYFAYGNHSLKELEQEFNQRKHLMYSFDLFKLELKSLESLSDSIIQHNSYAQQQWTSYKDNYLVKEDKTKWALAQKRLFENIDLVDKTIHIKLNNEHELKELYLLLNKNINTLEEQFEFPCLFKYKNGDITIKSYKEEINSKLYLRMHKDYKELRLDLFQDKNKLNYNASIDDFNILLNKAKNVEYIEYIEYIEKALKNINIVSIIISIQVYSNICKNKKEYELFEKMLIYVISNKNLSTLERSDVRSLFYNSIRVNSIELLKELISNKYCNKKCYLEYALGTAYGFNRSNFISYLTNEFDIKFSENIYIIALEVAISQRNIRKVKELCYSEKIKIKNFNTDISFVSDEIIEELLKHNFNINKNSKQTVETLVNCNKLDRLNFLKDKGLNLTFDETTKNNFLELANKKEHFEIYNWLKNNLKTSNKTNVINIFGAVGTGKTTLIKELNFDTNNTLIITLSWDTNYKNYKNVFYIDKQDRKALIKELNKPYKTVVFENLYNDYQIINNTELKSILLKNKETIFVISTLMQSFININMNYIDVKNFTINESKKRFLSLVKENK